MFSRRSATFSQRQRYDIHDPRLLAMPADADLLGALKLLKRQTAITPSNAALYVLIRLR